MLPVDPPGADHVVFYVVVLQGAAGYPAGVADRIAPVQVAYLEDAVVAGTAVDRGSVEVGLVARYAHPRGHLTSGYLVLVHQLAGQLAPRVHLGAGPREEEDDQVDRGHG